MALFGGSTVNVYGEAPSKVYFEPLRIECLINKSDQSWSSDDFGPDVNQNISFNFLKHELKNINLVPEIGDIILFKNNFYEVDSKVENQLILGRDPDYAISTETLDFGSSFFASLIKFLGNLLQLKLISLILLYLDFPIVT